MAPKLEYQPIFGMEQVTPSEAARNWTSLRLHNKCRLVRGDLSLLAICKKLNLGLDALAYAVSRTLDLHLVESLEVNFSSLYRQLQQAGSWNEEMDRLLHKNNEV